VLRLEIRVPCFAVLFPGAYCGLGLAGYPVGVARRRENEEELRGNMSAADGRLRRRSGAATAQREQWNFSRECEGNAPEESESQTPTAAAGFSVMEWWRAGPEEPLEPSPLLSNGDG
jgi:hypothetical protein